MDVRELLRKIEANWTKFDGDKDELFGIWNGALADVPGHKLQAAFDFMVKNNKYRPKPADVFDAFEKMGMASAKPEAKGEVNNGAMLAYAETRKADMVADWRRRNPQLWAEAERDRWDGAWLVEARKRAGDLGQLEYLARNHGWPKQAAKLFDLLPEEMGDGNEMRLWFSDAQIASLRAVGADLRSRPYSAPFQMDEDAA